MNLWYWFKHTVLGDIPWDGDQAILRQREYDQAECPPMVKRIHAHWMNAYHKLALKIQLPLVHEEALKEALQRTRSDGERKIRPIREGGVARGN